MSKLCCSVVYLIVLVFALASCGGYSVTGGPGKTVEPFLKSHVNDPGALLKINRVLVYPVLADAGVPFSSGERKQYSKWIEEYLKSETGMEIVSGMQPEGSLVTVREAEQTRNAQLLAKNAGAGGVLLTRVHHYQERKGSSIGALKPAYVYFSVDLLSVRDGSRIWYSSYRLRDQDLSRNLFRLGERLEAKKRGRGWLRASEIFDRGLEEALNDLQENRAREFSRG